MGNAIDEVKDIADVVGGTNDEDGIVDYLSSLYTMAGNGAENIKRVLEAI